MSIKSVEYALLRIDRLSGEKRLLIEILKRAINDAVGRWKTGPDSRESHMHEAKEWIALKTDYTKKPWSFEWVCEHLGVDSENVRKGIKELELELSKASEVKRLTTIEHVEIEFIKRLYD